MKRGERPKQAYWEETTTTYCYCVPDTKRSSLHISAAHPSPAPSPSSGIVILLYGGSELWRTLLSTAWSKVIVANLAVHLPLPPPHLAASSRERGEV